MKAIKINKEIIRATLFGILAGFLSIILLGAQPTDYGIAVTPLLLSVGVAFCIVAELTDTVKKGKAHYGALFHTIAALVVLVFALSKGMLEGYTYNIYGYYDGKFVEEVFVPGWEWIILFSLLGVRIIAQLVIQLKNLFKGMFDDIDISWNKD